MFCPRCGQQAAQEVRFCSRCGLALDAAAEIVEAGGNPEWYAARAEPGGGLTRRQRGTRKGLLIMTAGLVFFGLAVLLTAFKGDLFVFLPVAALVITAGLVRLLYALLLEEERADGKPAALSAADSRAGALRGARGGAELPPARAVPASLHARVGADTKDMLTSPHSVTESTTALLEDREGGRPARKRRAGE